MVENWFADFKRGTRTWIYINLYKRNATWKILSHWTAGKQQSSYNSKQTTIIILLISNNCCGKRRYNWLNCFSRIRLYWLIMKKILQNVKPYKWKQKLNNSTACRFTIYHKHLESSFLSCDRKILNEIYWFVLKVLIFFDGIKPTHEL